MVIYRKGDYNIGLNLINKIIQYKNLEKFNIAFCFNNEDNYKLLINIIEDNFKCYASYISNEFGNDIIPTLLMYNHIKKNNEYKHVIKLQTKTNIDMFNQLTNNLLTKKLKDLLLGFKQYSNCINYNDFYMRIINDQFNKNLIEKYKDYIDFNKSFIIGTIFYSKGIIFDKIMKNDGNYNYMVYLKDIKLLSRFSSHHNFDDLTKLVFKIYLFEDEDKTKKKIRLQLI